jgi:hypothetical protein
VKIALSSTWSDLENKGHPPWKNRRLSVGRCNFSFQQHTDIIPTATPTFSTTADLTMTMSMSPDIADYGFKMADTKPELEITFERRLFATRFHRLSPHFRPRLILARHWGHCLTFADVDRHRSTIADYQNSRWRTAKPEMEITFERQVMAPRFQRLSPHYRPSPTSPCHYEHCPSSSTTEIQDGGHHAGSGNNFRTVSDGAAIATSTPIFSATPDSDMTLSILPDVADYRNSRWRPPKPEMEMTIERNEFATRLQRQHPHL